MVCLSLAILIDGYVTVNLRIYLAKPAFIETYDLTPPFISSTTGSRARLVALLTQPLKERGMLYCGAGLARDVVDLFLPWLHA